MDTLRIEGQRPFFPASARMIALSACSLQLEVAADGRLGRR